MSVNTVTLLGHLSKDPELREFGVDGNCSIALNRRVKDGDGWREEVTFVDFAMWGKRAEAFAKYHSKGSLAFLEGRLKMDSWNDRNTGDKRYKMSVVAESWEFVGSKRNGSAVASSREENDTDDTPF
jgi:single-strand DNA-binding protein